MVERVVKTSQCHPVIHWEVSLIPTHSKDLSSSTFFLFSRRTGNQVFAYTKRKQVMADDNCLDAADAKGPVKLIRCHGMAGECHLS